MNIPDYLSPDQAEALEKVLKNIETERETILVGPAGSGKSTLTAEILRLCGRRTVIGAPTGKAALVSSEKTGQRASTIHRLLYGGAWFDRESKKLNFKAPGPPCDPGDLLLIDEASMIGSKIYKDVLSETPRSARILWVGDKEQLPPVKDTWGPDLERATSTLTQVHRQAENSLIIQYATAVREKDGGRWEQEFAEKTPESDEVSIWDGIDSAVEWLVDARLHNEDATALTYTHDSRKYVNTEVRKKLGFWDPNCLLKEGEHLVVRTNNYGAGIMNGETVRVTSVKRTEYRGEPGYSIEIEELPGMEFTVLEKHIEADPLVYREWLSDMNLRPRDAAKFLHVHYGQCLTVHSSQGSQWEKVGFINDPAFRRIRYTDLGRRMLYVAVTRASKQLGVFLE